MTKKSSICLFCLTALLLAGAVAVWRARETPVAATAAQPAPVIKTGIVTTSVDSHKPAESYSKAGDIRALPADPALAEALSHTSKLAYPLRLKAVRALQGATLTADQATYLRAFVADPNLPEGLTIQQIRALKNDVLNALCEQPGGEAATAAVLRTLYADETADPGLRDYALQHLVTLTERDPSLGWSAHWAAIDGKNTELAATALLHLSINLRSQVSGLNPQLSATERQRIEAAALRLATDTTAKDPARTTALQVCGQLKLTEARPLAYEIARSDSAGMPLRIAAVATLGDLGGSAAVRNYLRQLTIGPVNRLRVPARSALERFSIN